MAFQKADDRQWKVFMENHVSYDGETNMKSDFSKITKTAGVAYFEFVRAQWISCRDFQDPIEFCKMNGNMPLGFFEKNIRDHEATKEMEKDMVVITY